MEAEITERTIKRIDKKKILKDIDKKIKKRKKEIKKKFKSPNLNRKLSYRKGNPLKKLLSQSKPTIKTRGGEPINLWK